MLFWAMYFLTCSSLTFTFPKALFEHLSVNHYVGTLPIIFYLRLNVQLLVLTLSATFTLVDSLSMSHIFFFSFFSFMCAGMSVSGLVGFCV